MEGFLMRRARLWQPAPLALQGARRLSRGVTLVEALVALAVMSFGMLAVVGVQATLRFNSDIAKQRSEAVRIAQEAIEEARSYVQIEPDPTGVQRSYADVVSTAAADVAGYTTNTTYRLSRDVQEDAPAPGVKSLRVRVEWADRNGTIQAITLTTQIARENPALTGAVVNQADYADPQLKPGGRHAAIPTLAHDLGDGRSVFTPPVPAGTPGTVAWVFDNNTAYITGVCTISAGTPASALTAASIAACADNYLAHLLAGVVQFATTPTQPTAADAENPPGQARNLDMQLYLADSRIPVCFDDAPSTAATANGRRYARYYCAIPANATRTWDGYATVTPLPFTDNPNSAWAFAGPDTPAEDVTHRLCRYTPALNDAQFVPNEQHPYQYRTVYADAAKRLPLPMPPLVNQNFLVVLAANTCPTDGPANPALGDFVNSNTLEHLPLP
jgi:Tfp pilus assembly protein PilV